MLEPVPVERIAGIAHRATLYPMLPQHLQAEELEALAGAHFGIDLIGRTIHPEIAPILARFGGGMVDAAMKAKLQSWLAGWIEPPQHYLIHHPVKASGQWWRIFRTAVHMEADLEEAHEAARTLPMESLEARYSHVLGLGARGRYASHAKWWNDVLATIRMGTWHAALYSPRYRAFISPLEGEKAEDEIGDLRSEWPKQAFRLYPTNPNSPQVFDLSRLISAGAFIEVLGDITPAPPFGSNWGPGVLVEAEHGVDEVVAGIILARSTPDGEGARTIFRADLTENGKVALDGPDPFRLAQAIYGATEWCPEGIPQVLMAPEALSELVTNYATALAGPTGDDSLLVPKAVFEDAIKIHPGLVPVYGRVISLVV